MTGPIPTALAAIAGAVTSLTIIGAALWWLLWPRLRDLLLEVSRSAQRVEKEVAGDQPDTLSRHARVAAGYASELPELKEQLGEIAARQRDQDTWRDHIESRLGTLEETLIVLMSGQLRAQIADDTIPHPQSPRAAAGTWATERKKDE